MNYKLNKLAPLVIVGLCIFAGLESAYADKVCISSTLTKKGRIKNKATLIANDQNCPKRAAVFLESDQVTQLVTSTITSNNGNTIIIEGEQGPAGETGPQGPQGPAGAQGPQGPAGSADSSFIVTTSKLGTVNSTTPKTEFVACPSGYTAIGGNASVISGLLEAYDGPIRISYSGPSLTGAEFQARAVEGSATSDSWGLLISAICKKK